ncbi:MAG: uracil-DNA glycosylase family protein [Lewinella sp.]|nr:uracil-DNA glycosylase family protein [Lewinella sp.]
MPEPTIITEARNCRICAGLLPHDPRPVFTVHPAARMLIVGQAPGRKVHESGVPWQDASGERLRDWLGYPEADFYDPSLVAILPMGFCFPGKGKSGDLPPRPECAPAWHEALLRLMPNLELTLLIGQYAQEYYLGSDRPRTLTETVRQWENYLPDYLPLPHPSPRNNIWLRKHPWFTEDLLPVLRRRANEIRMKAKS